MHRCVIEIRDSNAPAGSEWVIDWLPQMLARATEFGLKAHSDTDREGGREIGFAFDTDDDLQAFLSDAQVMEAQNALQNLYDSIHYVSVRLHNDAEAP